MCLTLCGFWLISLLLSWFFFVFTNTLKIFMKITPCENRFCNLNRSSLSHAHTTCQKADGESLWVHSSNTPDVPSGNSLYAKDNSSKQYLLPLFFSAYFLFSRHKDTVSLKWLPKKISNNGTYYPKSSNLLLIWISENIGVYFCRYVARVK